MSRYGYKPGGAPETSPAHHARVEAWFAWDREHRRIASQAVDLAMAGRFEECMDFVETVQKPCADREPVIGLMITLTAEQEQALLFHLHYQDGPEDVIPIKHPDGVADDFLILNETCEPVLTNFRPEKVKIRAWLRSPRLPYFTISLPAPMRAGDSLILVSPITIEVF